LRQTYKIFTLYVCLSTTFCFAFVGEEHREILH
jgi:hypothetical protein